MPSLPELDDFEQALVDQWSEIHKRSALVHILMVALAHGPKWSGDLVDFIDNVNGGAWGVDERSLYRALRRLERSEVIEHHKESVPGTGAKRKVFTITASGRRVLDEYEQTTLAYLNRLDEYRPSKTSGDVSD